MKSLVSLPFLLLIRVYQKTISPDHSFIGKRIFRHGYCLYQPTCSEYTYQAINAHGALKGVWMGIKRVLRCNPWSQGGYDPPEA